MGHNVVPQTIGHLFRMTPSALHYTGPAYRAYKSLRIVTLSTELSYRVKGTLCIAPSLPYEPRTMDPLRTAVLLTNAPRIKTRCSLRTFRVSRFAFPLSPRIVPGCRACRASLPLSPRFMLEVSPRLAFQTCLD